MGYKEIPGGVEALAHEDGKFRIGLRNLPPDSDRIIYFKDQKGVKQNEWPIFVIRKPFNGPERRMFLPEAVLKAHGKIPVNADCEASDFKSKSGSKMKLSDAAIDNVEYKPSEHGNSPYKSKPKEEPAQDGTPEEPIGTSPETEPQADADEAPKADESTKVAEEAESISDVAKGSANLTAKEAIAIIGKYDFEELRDLNFYTEDERDRGPRVTVTEAWENKKEDFES